MEQAELDTQLLDVETSVPQLPDVRKYNVSLHYDFTKVLLLGVAIISIVP